MRPLHLCPAVVLTALFAAWTPAGAQEAAAVPLPEMAAIERAWQRGDYVTVREGLKRLAEEEGGALAQYRYGRVLLEGRGGPRDLAAARDWLEKAVAQNQPEAATLLARLYLGDDRFRDPVRAAQLLANAAARGETEAQYYLGLLYREGVGLAADPVQAFNWFLAAAEAGHLEARYALSRAYSRGEGTRLDTAEALRWLTGAAEDGHAEAQFFLGLALDRGAGAVQDVPQAIGWYRRAAEGGHVLAQRALGLKYLDGSDTGADPDEARRWLEAAAGAGDRVATVALGLAEATGEGLAQDVARGLERLTSASNAGLAEASVALGQLLQAGGPVPADLDRAVAFYRRGAEQGSAQAAVLLGQMAGAGQLDSRAPPQLAVPWAIAAAAEGDAAALAWVEARAAEGLRPAQSALGRYLIDREGRAGEAVGLLRLAAAADDVAAQYALGLALVSGTGTAQDYVEAHKWLNVAAALGHPDAAAKRAVAADLMTPEEVAEAQARARTHFAEVAARPPAGAEAGK